MFFFLSLMPFSSAVYLSAQSECRYTHARIHTQMHTYTELHINMNIDFLGENLDVYTQLYIYIYIYIYINAPTDITSQLLPSLG